MIKAPLDTASPAAIASMEMGTGHESAVEAVVTGRRILKCFLPPESKYCGASYKASMCVSE